jgi:hypothetical protein
MCDSNVYQKAPGTYTSNKTIVICSKCRQAYPTVYADIGMTDCASFHIEKTFSEYYIDGGVSEENLPLENIILECGYGSRYDTDKFVYGYNIPMAIDQVPEWISQLIGEKHEICDNCIDEMLKNKELRKVGGELGHVHPVYCTMCDHLYQMENPDDYNVIDGVVISKIDSEYYKDKKPPNTSNFIIFDSETNIDYFLVNPPNNIRNNDFICHSCFNKLQIKDNVVTF